jgi:2-haloacid dehalogenase
MDFSRVKYVIFDTFGTVVDWRGTIIEEGQALGKKYGFDIDWNEFALIWHIDYRKTCREVAAGKRNWEPHFVDKVHIRKLKELMKTFKFPAISDGDIENFNLVFHRLRPWPDTIEGLTRLKKKFGIGSFSNGDFSLILNMAKYSGIPWDFIATTDLFKKFKPDPSVYVDVVNLLGVDPSQIVFAAAHQPDLDGGKLAGCITVYVSRLQMWGDNSYNFKELFGFEKSKLPVDFEVPDFIGLADLLCGKS